MSTPSSCVRVQLNVLLQLLILLVQFEFMQATGGVTALEWNLLMAKNTMKNLRPFARQIDCILRDHLFQLLPACPAHHTWDSLPFGCPQLFLLLFSRQHQADPPGM